MAPIICVTEDGKCDKKEGCITYSFWEGLDNAINEYYNRNRKFGGVKDEK